MPNRAAGSPASAAPPPPAPAYATTREAATYTRMGRSTIEKHISAGRLKAHRVGGRVLVAYADLDAFMTATPVEPRPARAQPPA